MKKLFILSGAFALFLSGCSNDDGSNYGNVAEVSNPSDMQTAIYSGSSDITLTQPLTEDMSLSIPNFYTSGRTLTLRIPQANGKNIALEEQCLFFFSYPDLLVDVGNANNLSVEMPESQVGFNGTATTLTASTETLTIEQGAHVGTLNVVQGNVRVLGTVDTYGTIPEETKILLPVATMQELRDKLAAPYDPITNSGVVLTADISGTFETISGAQESQDAFRIGDAGTYGNSDYDGYVFDGNGFTLSGSAWNNVFAIYADDVVVNDLIVMQTAAQKAALKSDGNPALNNGISIYRSKRAVLNNVTVLDCGKAGIVVNSSIATANNLTASGNAWGGVNVSKGGNPPEGDKPEFYLNSGTFTGQVKPIYVSANTTSDYTVTTPAGWAHTTVDGDIIYTPGN